MSGLKSECQDRSCIKQIYNRVYDIRFLPGLYTSGSHYLQLCGPFSYSALEKSTFIEFLRGAPAPWQVYSCWPWWMVCVPTGDAYKKQCCGGLFSTCLVLVPAYFSQCLHFFLYQFQGNMVRHFHLFHTASHFLQAPQSHLSNKYALFPGVHDQNLDTYFWKKYLLFNEFFVLVYILDHWSRTLKIQS
jgi:hypothetical protein